MLNNRDFANYADDSLSYETLCSIRTISQAWKTPVEKYYL